MIWWLPAPAGCCGWWQRGGGILCKNLAVRDGDGQAPGDLHPTCLDLIRSRTQGLKNIFGRHLPFTLRCRDCCSLLFSAGPNQLICSVLPEVWRPSCHREKWLGYCEALSIYHRDGLPLCYL